MISIERKENSPNEIKWNGMENSWLSHDNNKIQVSGIYAKQKTSKFKNYFDLSFAR